MIKLFTGIPGSGKTYRAVHDFMKVKNEYYLFHNIDGLKSEKIDGGQYIKDFKSLDISFNDFFSLENQKQICAQVNEKYNRKVLIIIDEAQVFMGKVNESVKEWISYHRHLGQDIWIITQSKYNLAREYTNLVEIEIQGKRGFVFQSFIYSYFDHGERVKTDRIKKDTKIFDLYTSFNIAEKDKPKSNLFKFMIIMGLTSLVVGVFFVYKLQSGFKKQSKEKEQVKEETGNIPSKRNIEELKEIEPKYQYVGFIKNRIIVTDQSGNIFYRDTLFNDSENITDREKMKAMAMHPQKGPHAFVLYPIRNSAEASAGRARAGATALKGAENQLFKKVVVRIE